MKKTTHDRIAEQLASKEGVDYNRGKGPDIKGPKRTIEVAVSASDLNSSVGQVRRHRKPYIATTPGMIDDAIRVTQGTGVGVMNPQGEIVKRTGGKRK